MAKRFSKFLKISPIMGIGSSVTKIARCVELCNQDPDILILVSRVV